MKTFTRFAGVILVVHRQLLLALSRMAPPGGRAAPVSLAALLGMIVAGQPITALAETAFRFTSTPGSWVGHGYLTYEVRPDLGWSFTASTSADHNYIRLSTRSLDPTAPLDNYYWDLELQATGGNPLSPGLYENASRYPFNPPSEPGMWLSGNHRGDNIISGYFRVLEAEFGAGATVSRFSADFRQYDEGNPNNWVDGQFRFNASVPEPATWLLLAVGALVIAIVRRPALARR